MPAVYSFFVPQISCGLCIAHIEKKLKDSVALGVERVASNVSRKKIGIILREDLSEERLRRNIKEALAGTGFSPEFCDEVSLKKQTRWHWIQGAIGTTSGLMMLMLSLWAFPLSMATMIPMALVSGILTIVLGRESFKRAYIEWRNRELSMDSLFAVSTAIVLLTSIASFFVPWLPMMFDTGLLIFGFRHLGLGIEGALVNTMQFGARFIDRLPKEARIITESGHALNKKIELIQVGETIEVLPGEFIPLDGECLDPSRTLYETIITGDPMPREVKKGAVLLSGMVVAEGNAVQLKVTKPFKQSHLYRLDQRMFDAEFEEKAGYEIAARKLLKYFVPAVFLFAALSVVVIGSFFPLAIAIRCAIAVLVSACPCTLGLVVPLAVMIGKYKAAANGIEFRSGEQLQRAGEVDSVVFDFNGTLTMGLPKVLRTHRLDPSLSEADFFQIIASLETDSRHPVGRALFEYSSVKSAVKLSSDVVRKFFGVTGQIQGKSYLLGSRRMLLDSGVDPRQLEYAGVINPGENVVYLACDQQLVGYAVLTTALRIGAIEAVKLLQKMRIECYICSGSELEVLSKFAKELNIPLANIKASQRGVITKQLNSGDVVAEDQNDDKSRFIKQLQAKGRCVAMVGDAANDALAIGTADVGVAICNAHSEETVTQRRASAVVKGASLLPVVNAFVISRQMKLNIKQNLVMSLSYNMITECLAGGVLVALGVIINPGVGVALMIVQMLLILWNASRFREQSVAQLDEHVKRGNHQEPRPYGQVLSPRIYPSPIFKKEPVECGNTSLLPTNSVSHPVFS